MTIQTLLSLLTVAECRKWAAYRSADWHANMRIAAVWVGARVALEMKTSRNAMVIKIVGKIAILAGRASPTPKKGLAYRNLGWIVRETTLGTILACA